MEAADDADFAGRDRRAAEQLRRRPRRPRACERVVYLGGHRARPTGAPSPHIASRIEVEEILLEAAPVGHRAARVDPDRRRARRPSACSSGWSSGCGCCPCRPGATNLHPADRRARRHRVPRPHAPGARRPPGRSLDIAGPDVRQLRRDDRADRRVDGGRPHAARPRLLAHAAGQRGGERGDRPAARAGAAADGEPGARAAPARRRRGAAPVRDPPAARSSARWSARWPSGSAPRSWRHDEGRAQRSRSPRRPRTVYDLIADPDRLGEWVTIHQYAGRRRARRAGEGREDDTVPEARRAQLQGEVDGGRERPPAPPRVGGQGPDALEGQGGERARAETGTGTRFSYINEYSLPGGPLGNMAGPMVRRVTGKELDADVAENSKDV